MAETVIMPKLGFDMAEGTLVRWVINEGQPVQKGAVLAEIETDKATVEVTSDYEGIVARHLIEEKAVVPVNTPIAIITAPGEKWTEEKEAGSKEQVAGEKEQVAGSKLQVAGEEEAGSKLQVAGEKEEGAGVKASPLARRLAREKGISLSALSGTGPGGRIVKKDVESAKAAPAGKPAAAAAVLPAYAPGIVSQPEKQVPLSKLRTIIARRMSESKQQAPHFYVTHDYDMAALMDLRKQINAMLPEEEKISVNDMIVKAAALTLRRFPNLNASFQGSQVVQHGEINIGIAVAVEGGLLTVVCRNADQKPLRQIAVEVKAMVSRTRDGKVRPDDIEGSTFSVSNMGMYDVEVFSAIINPPEAAIIAIGTVKDVPVVKDGQLGVGTRMKVTISVDHRVSDGVEAAKFMQALAEPLEKPLMLLL